MTIHKSQGLTIDKIFLDLGKTEYSENATFVSLSRVRCWKDLYIKEIIKDEWIGLIRKKVS